MSALARAFTIDDLRRLARRRLPRAVFDFVEGGAGDEQTVVRNRAAFERLLFPPKVLVPRVGDLDRTIVRRADSP